MRWGESREGSSLEQEAGRGGRTVREEDQEDAEDEKETQVGRKPFADPIKQISIRNIDLPSVQCTVKVSTPSSR